MSLNKLSELEKRYEIFYKALSSEQQHNQAFLMQKAEELEGVDLPLAYRIMQRVKGLGNDDNLNQRLNKLKSQMNSKHPDYMRASSEEQPLSERYIKPLTEKLKLQTSSIKKSKLILKLRSTLGIIFVPLLIFSFYQIIWVSERYESQAGLIVKEPDNTSTLDPSMALLTGLGASSSNTDTELIKAFIHSNDMLLHLEIKLGINEHFSDSSIDYFSRLEKNASAESRLAYYIEKVNVEIDEKSGVIRVFSQAFSPEFAQKITQHIINRAEWFINEISHELGKKQLVFVQNEHALTEQRLQKAKARLLTFQQKYNLLDPEAEGLAVQEVTYGLEAKIAMKEAELSTLESSMSKTAPAVISAKSELTSLRAQLEMQRSKLTQGLLSVSTDNENTNDSVGEMLSKFTDYKIDMEFALQAYSASKVSLEKSRIETYRQIKYLMVLEAPMLPQETKYPDVIYNISLFLVLQLMLIGIGKIILATVEELR